MTTKTSRGGFSKVVNSKRMEPGIEKIVHQHFFRFFSSQFRFENLGRVLIDKFVVVVVVVLFVC